MITHCFSMDVEGFCEAVAESLTVPPEMLSSRQRETEIETNVAEALELLEEHNVKGTFFVLGRVAESQPEVVRKIADGGHEIASHGFEHLRLYNLSPEQVRQAVFRSKKVVEDVSGMPVKGFRAPDSSINRKSLYILDLILEAGYQYESSLYPIEGHDVYGVPGVERWVHRLSNGLVESPDVGSLRWEEVTSGSTPWFLHDGFSARSRRLTGRRCSTSTHTNSAVFVLTCRG